MGLAGIWIRVLLITFVSNLFCVKFMGTLLGWRKSTCYVMVGLEVKVLFCNIFLYYFFLPCYGKEMWGKTIFGLLYFLTAVLVLLLYYQTFRGSLLKIGIVGIWSELFCVPAIYTCIAVLNFLERRQNLLAVEAEILPADFLILPIIWGYFRLLKVLSRRWHYLIHRWEPKHRKILWTFYSIYMFLAVSSSYEINVFTTPVISFAAILITTVFILGVLFLSRKHQRQVFARKEFLDMEQKMMREHYRMITVQIQGLEKSRETVEQQMEMLMTLGEKSDSEEKICQYILELQDRYQEIRAGICCNDWIVDAVLCHMSNMFSSHGVKSQYLFWKYSGNVISSVEMAEFLFTVLDCLLKECLRQPEGTERRLVLKAEDLKSQIIIVCLYNWEIRRRKMKNLLRPFVTMYEGNMEWKTDKENTGFIIRVSGENIK